MSYKRDEILAQVATSDEWDTVFNSILAEDRGDRLVAFAGLREWAAGQVSRRRTPHTREAAVRVARTYLGLDHEGDVQLKVRGDGDLHVLVLAAHGNGDLVVAFG